jgi:hypothetical protein
METVGNNLPPAQHTREEAAGNDFARLQHTGLKAAGKNFAPVRHTHYFHNCDSQAVPFAPEQDAHSISVVNHQPDPVWPDDRQ